MNPTETYRGVIAVTGASGFIGMHTVAALKAAGFSVRLLLGPPAASAPNTCMAFDMYADICDASAMREFVTGAAAVVHIAGPPSVAESLDDPATFARIHVEGTTNVLGACRRAHVQRIVYLSSAEVYGRPLTHVVAEDHPLSARSPYAAAKIGAESMVAAFANSFDLSATILRPFSVYGPGASSMSLLGELTRAVQAGGPLRVRDLRPVRDYVYVGDVAAAIVRAVELEPTAGVLHCNVGTMRGASVAELCHLLASAYDSTTQVTESCVDRRPVGSEILRLVADSTRARQVLGWTPGTTLEDGLRLTVASASSA